MQENSRVRLEIGDQDGRSWEVGIRGKKTVPSGNFAQDGL